MHGVNQTRLICVAWFVLLASAGAGTLSAQTVTAAKTPLPNALGLIPMTLGLEAGSEQYAPLARAILSGLAVSGVVTVFLVPTVYYLIHRNHQHESGENNMLEEVQA